MLLFYVSHFIHVLEKPVDIVDSDLGNCKSQVFENFLRIVSAISALVRKKRYKWLYNPSLNARYSTRLKLTRLYPPWITIPKIFRCILK